MKLPLQLNNLELDNKKILIIGIISLIIFYLDFRFILNMQLTALKNIQPKIVNINKDIDTLNKELATLQDLKNKLKLAKQEGRLPVKKIISEKELVSLLDYISVTGNKNNIRIMQIKPSKEPKSGEEKTLKEGGKITPVLIALDLSAGYHDFGKFINELENAEQFFAVQDIKITRVPNEYMRQDINLVLKTYVKQ